MCAFFSVDYEAKIAEFEEHPNGVPKKEEPVAAATAATDSDKMDQESSTATTASSTTASKPIGVIKAAILNPLSRFSIASKLASSSSEMDKPSDFEFSLGAPAG